VPPQCCTLEGSSEFRLSCFGRAKTREIRGVRGETMSDTRLHPLISRNLAQMGYAQARPIQQAAAAPILAGRDVIGLAQTGTGKTAAFAAPVLHHLLSHKPGEDHRPIRPDERLRALVVCPTRELAQQVQQESAVIAQGTAVRTACVFGKAAIAPQAHAIARGVDLLVGTPGRLIELLEHGLLSLSHVRYVVIDEGDRMLDMGFLPQVRRILERVGPPAQGDGRGCQIMLFSATMPPAMEDLSRTFMRDPVRIEIGKQSTPVAHVVQHLIPVPDSHKVEALLHLLGAACAMAAAGSPPRSTAASRRSGVLVFCRTRRRVGWVGAALERHGLRVGMLHGDRSQAQRRKALDRFKAGDLDVLVATDVAARGLHIPAVATVVNYDLPLAPEEYVHRVGRAAHGLEAPVNPAQGLAEAFTLLDPDDRLAWRKVVDVTQIEVFAEHQIGGWSPPQARRTRHDNPRPAAGDDREVGAGSRARRDRRRETRRRKGRSHASAPIRKGQKPGAGVKRRG
jgi:ATP-dependent RNA helicase RhlE